MWNRSHHPEGLGSAATSPGEVTGRTLELSIWRVSRKRDGKGMFSRLRGQAEEREGAPGEEDAVVSDT